MIAAIPGQACDSLTDRDRLKLETYIKTWYKLPNEQRITLVDSNVVDAACYRKVVFHASVPAPELVMYLTPDKERLVVGVMDLTVDPSTAQRKMRQEMANRLMSGAWLVLGEDAAAVKMVVFSDFQCPYCKMFSSMVNKLTREEQEQVQIIYRQLPLNIHSWARDAAALTTCVALEDKAAFWKLHDFLFAHQEELSKETLQGKVMEFITHETSIDTKAVTACLSQKSFEGRLHRDEQLAMDLGITSTPSVFLNGQRMSVRSIEDLRNALRTAQLENTVMDEQRAPKTASRAARPMDGRPQIQAGANR